ncbi:MAG: hypothetical protein AWU57_945 [Marinobacter sp. T13-3]|nr:MAG: hypothetical protein AWU57_945 [Marinobacter sp. T13-3]
MSESNGKQRIEEQPNQVAKQFCEMIGSDDARLKEAFRLAIQKAMSDAVVSSKRDLLQAAFDSGAATTPLVELVNEAIPTFGGAEAEYSSKVFGPQ